MRGYVRGCLLVGVAIAACDEGLVLEVHVPEGSRATSVKLFVGFEQCFDDRGMPCPGLTPPQGSGSGGNPRRELLAGLVYHREPIDDQVRVAKVENGVARFRLESANGLAKVPLAVAIDDLGESAQYIHDLLLDGARKYVVELAPAMSGVLGKPPQPTTSVVEIWNQPTMGLPCMGFERWSDNNLLRRMFVVPSDDLDCDGITVNECAPYDHLGFQPPTLGTVDCLRPYDLDSAPTCRLGGRPSCTDTSTTVASCIPSDYCLPSVYCDSGNLNCASPSTVISVAKCLFDTPTPTVSVACTIGVREAPTGTHLDVCSESIELDVATPSMAGNVITCPTPDTQSLLLAPRVMEPILGFSQTVVDTMNRVSSAPTPFEITLVHDSGCKYRFAMSGGLGFQPRFDELPIFAQLWISTGGPVHKLLVPIAITVGSPGDCSARCELKIDVADALYSCARR